VPLPRALARTVAPPGRGSGARGSTSAQEPGGQGLSSLVGGGRDLRLPLAALVSALVLGGLLHRYLRLSPRRR
jgi:hypothetical protein